MSKSKKPTGSEVSNELVRLLVKRGREHKHAWAFGSSVCNGHAGELYALGYLDSFLGDLIESSPALRKKVAARITAVRKNIEENSHRIELVRKTIANSAKGV